MPERYRLAHHGHQPLASRPWYPAVIFATGLAITVAATLLLLRSIASSERERFDSAVEAVRLRVILRMDTYAGLLRAAAGLLQARPGIARADFARFVDQLDLAENYPGSRGLGWSGPVGTGAEEERILRWLGEQGIPEAALWPQPARPDRQAILLYEPLTPAARRVLGFDMGYEAMRREAMELAASHGTTVATHPVRLVADTGPERHPALLLYHPSAAGPGPLAATGGLVYTALRCDELFASVLSRSQGADLEVAMRIADVGSEGPPDELFASPGWGGLATALHHRSESAMVYGRPWRLEFRSTPWLERQSNGWIPQSFGIGGALLSALLFLLARSQSRAAILNARLYQLSIAERRQAEVGLDVSQRLASDLDHRTVAQAVADAGCTLTGAPFGAFLAVHGDGGDRHLETLALAGPTSAHPPAVPIMRISPLLAPTIDGGATVRIAALDADPRAGGIPPMPGLPAEGAAVASYLAVPVHVGHGPVLGALLFAHPQPDRFSAEHERLLIGLAIQAAVSLKNARAYQAERAARHIAARRAEDLARANAELQQFVYVSSHDLQEPLRTISQYLDLLGRRHGGGLDPAAARYLAVASESARRMYDLLNDLLTYSRLGRDAEREDIDLDALVRELLQDIQATIAASGATVEAEDLPRVHGERAKLRLVLQNLVGNALKFHADSPPLIRISGERDAYGTTVRVSDNGIGIDLQHHQVIFEVFERLHDRSRFPGTGIGLAICKKVIEQHGGRIWVESAAGAGATFCFTIPDEGSGPVPVIRP